jgi:hypothetical protein
MLYVLGFQIMHLYKNKYIYLHNDEILVQNILDLSNLVLSKIPSVIKKMCYVYIVQ